MPVPQHTYEPFQFDEARAAELLASRSFIEAFTGAFHLLGSALVFSPKTSEFKEALAALRSIDLVQDWPFGSAELLAQAQEALVRGAGETESELLREYTRLFRGPGHLPAPPWGSVYMDRDKVMYGWTWVELRNWMRAHGFVAFYEENDPEDHLARLLLLAVEVIREKPQLICEFLGNHLLCWAPRFLGLLEQHAQSPSYVGVAKLTRASLDDIRELFAITPAGKKLYL